MTLPPLIIAHRGASSYAPENTLAALQMAVDAGADGVEFDVQLAADGIPVVIHDLTINRTALRDGNVSDLTSVGLSKIDVGSWFNAKYPKRSKSDFCQETIPTLLEVLHILAAFKGLIYIELKPTSRNCSDLVKSICDTVRKSHLLPQMIFKSFYLSSLLEIKHRLPDVKTAALFGPTAKEILRRRKHILAIAHKSGASQISLHHALISRKLAKTAVDAPVPVTVWTVDNTRWLGKCTELGIGALITNDPAKFLEFRKRRKS